MRGTLTMRTHRNTTRNVIGSHFSCVIFANTSFVYRQALRAARTSREARAALPKVTHKRKLSLSGVLMTSVYASCSYTKFSSFLLIWIIARKKPVFVSLQRQEYIPGYLKARYRTDLSVETVEIRKAQVTLRWFALCDGSALFVQYRPGSIGERGLYQERYLP